MNFLYNSFSTLRYPCKVNIDVEPPKRKRNEIFVTDPKEKFGSDGSPQKLVLVSKDDPINGSITIIPEKPFEHSGIKIELFGEMGNFFIKTNKSFQQL